VDYLRHIERGDRSIISYLFIFRYYIILSNTLCLIFILLALIWRALPSPLCGSPLPPLWERTSLDSSITLKILFRRREYFRGLDHRLGRLRVIREVPYLTDLFISRVATIFLLFL
jgi:hypothetical protein